MRPCHVKDEEYEIFATMSATHAAESTIKIMYVNSK